VSRAPARRRAAAKPARKRTARAKPAARRAQAQPRAASARRAGAGGGSKSAARARATRVAKTAPKAKGRARAGAAARGAPRAARKSAAGRPAAARRAPRAAKRPSGRPALRVVRRRAPPPPPPFSGATAGASAKELALFEFVRARVAFTAAIQGMGAAAADRPTAPGKWSPRQIVLHVAYWDREMLRHLEPAWRDNVKVPLTYEDILRANPGGVEELSHLDWEAAKRFLQATRERLLEALQSIPDEPAGMWTRGHALGAMIHHLTHHDRHHAGVIKAARASGGD